MKNKVIQDFGQLQIERRILNAICQILLQRLHGSLVPHAFSGLTIDPTYARLTLRSLNGLGLCHALCPVMALEYLDVLGFRYSMLLWHWISLLIIIVINLNIFAGLAHREGDEAEPDEQLRLQRVQRRGDAKLLQIRELLISKFLVFLYC